MSSILDASVNINIRFRSLLSQRLIPISLNKAMFFTRADAYGASSQWCEPSDNIQLVGLLMHRSTDSCTLTLITISKKFLQTTPWY
jgi:hypothetical protein